MGPRRVLPCCGDRAQGVWPALCVSGSMTPQGTRACMALPPWRSLPSRGAEKYPRPLCLTQAQYQAAWAALARPGMTHLWPPASSPGAFTSRSCTTLARVPEPRHPAPAPASAPNSPGLGGPYSRGVCALVWTGAWACPATPRGLRALGSLPRLPFLGRASLSGRAAEPALLSPGEVWAEGLTQ